ncbi:mannose-6-phosphate isomerase, class I [Halobacillus amylolyticus]|uniref:mannose-6-phosphate isomerase, class I n=1 Tax=Halobacillus amylolyticus TaxID=2932259 RepID=UPI0029623BD5|nr:mannose-6-phosphate isomerase, class I [Halobacillus amylolyticus]
MLGISGHSNGSNLIKNGPLRGKTLAEAWNNHRELFGNEEGDEFPLLVKILDSKKDLSVQVHPDDEYARNVEDETYGKTECWYVIDCEEGAEIIFGHHANSKEELASMIENGQWDELLHRIPVQPGEFYYVPSGTIHAIGEGIQILETQQSSDITYRVYDYDRTDKDGQKRELHLDRSLDVTNVPHVNPSLERDHALEAGVRTEKLVEEAYFTVHHLSLDGKSNPIIYENYQLFSALEGEGNIITDEGVFPFSKGDHFIIPATVESYTVEGRASLITSHSNK